MIGINSGTIVLITTGGIIILSGIAFLASLMLPNFGKQILGRFLPSLFSDGRLKKLAYMRAISLSFIYILLGTGFILLAIPTFLIAGIFILLSIVCVICAFLFQSKLGNLS